VSETNENGKKSGVFTINGEEFTVVKRGRAQAEQVVNASTWLTRYGKDMYDKVSDSESASGLEIFMSIVESLSADALIDMFVVVFGCDKAFADEHFDVAMLIEGVVALYDGSNSVKELVSRFFSNSASKATTESSST
jgi:hypothetical protein